MRSICVYCGSSPGADPLFMAGAKALGKVIAETDRVLVYGGAKVGLMGALADSVLAAGGKVIGVVPRGLVEKKVAHDSLTELHVVSSMHKRKEMMADLADAFIAMPGGLGTLEEWGAADDITAQAKAAGHNGWEMVMGYNRQGRQGFCFKRPL